MVTAGLQNLHQHRQSDRLGIDSLKFFMANIMLGLFN